MLRLDVDGEPFGLIEIYDERRRRFEPGEIRLCSALAGEAGAMIARTRMSERLEEAYFATLGALAAALEAKDAYTNDHASQIAELAGAVCERLGIPAGEARIIRLGALLHDIGKIGIPEAILRKPGPLSAEEMARMQEHPDIGARILEPVPYFADLVPLVRSSHERWDGGGYPDGLGGPAIPLGSRVIAVCDAFHAMIEDRVYRKALSVEGAVAEIERCSGSQFDPSCAGALVAVVRETGSGRVARGGVVRIAKRPSSRASGRRRGYRSCAAPPGASVGVAGCRPEDTLWTPIGLIRKPASRAPTGVPATLMLTVMANARPCSSGGNARWRIANIEITKGAVARPAMPTQAIPTSRLGANGSISSGSRRARRRPLRRASDLGRSAHSSAPAIDLAESAAHIQPEAPGERPSCPAPRRVGDRRAEADA
jgi:putative nucleotidyltransferase with HDIG domain